MVSEGVDIPRLRVGVYATTTTELFFRQAVGRLVRWSPGVADQKAYLLIPDDARLRGWAHRIAETRRHSLHRDSSARSDADPADLGERREEVAPDAEQLSLFAVISAVATETHEGAGGPEPVDDSMAVDYEEDLVVDLPVLSGGPPHHPGVLPPRAGAPVGGDGGPAGVFLTLREHKVDLRQRNADLARSMVHKTGWSHAQVNAELNRLAGVRNVTEATLEQLERRLRQAEHWYRRL